MSQLEINPKVRAALGEILKLLRAKRLEAVRKYQLRDGDLPLTFLEIEQTLDKLGLVEPSETAIDIDLFGYHNSISWSTHNKILAEAFAFGDDRIEAAHYPLCDQYYPPGFRTVYPTKFGLEWYPRPCWVPTVLYLRRGVY